MDEETKVMPAGDTTSPCDGCEPSSLDQCAACPHFDGAAARGSACTWCGRVEMWPAGADRDAIHARLKAHEMECPGSPLVKKIAKLEQLLAVNDLYEEQLTELGDDISAHLAVELVDAQAKVRALQDQVDLNRDEFARIAACPFADDEIKQICERSQERITQDVPVIRQRDEALYRVKRLEEANASLREQFPGSPARHAVISDDCRRGRGDAGAFTEAMARLAEAYWQAVGGWHVGRGVKLHLILAVDRPPATEGKGA